MKIHRIVLCSLILLCVSGCKSHSFGQSSGQEIAIRVPETAPEQAEPDVAQPEEAVPQIGCPSQVDVLASAAECQKLINVARHLVRNVKLSDATSESSALIAQWNEKEKLWKAQKDQLMSNCELLLGADGTAVFPQIPLALKKLNRADECLVKSIESATLGHRKKARAYLRRAQVASVRATELLDCN